MSVKNKVPEIRFKGFSGEWEERSLDSVYRKIRNAFVGTATPYYVKEGNFYLESNNVKDGKIVLVNPNWTLLVENFQTLQVTDHH
ncbi:restriction endonuclease subunit S domain-containing protein [Shewanella baltica]|uniref:hypothetical protein n=1 Tax=Shewanella baltica TaxID=62322 RepID=UPI000A3096D7|nr:hypothetical protein [Shewanella baltica]